MGTEQQKKAKNSYDVDDEDFDELADAPNLLEKNDDEKSAGQDRSSLKTLEIIDDKWIPGTVLIGLFLLYVSYTFFKTTIRIHHYLNFINYMGCTALLCGLGLLLRQNWARLLSLFFVPLFFGFLLRLAISKGIPAHKVIFFWGSCSLSLFAFIYLLLPPVKRIFTSRKIKIVSQEFRLKNLIPPPRQVPLSLKLAAVFGDQLALGIMAISGFVFFGTVFMLKKSIGRFNFHTLGDPAQLIYLLVVLFFFVTFIIVTILLVKAGSDQIALLENGLQGYATLTKKVEVHTRHSTIYRLTFEYEIDGKKYKFWDDSGTTRRLEDEAKEPILYDPKSPKDAMLLDTLSAHITVDYLGNFVNKYPFMGYIYASLPVILILAMIYVAVK